jgi:hypothetical protein
MTRVVSPWLQASIKSWSPLVGVPIGARLAGLKYEIHKVCERETTVGKEVGTMEGLKWS